MRKRIFLSLFLLLPLLIWAGPENTVKVRFFAGEGRFTTEQDSLRYAERTFTVGAPYADGMVAVPVPVREGFVFGGWYRNALPHDRVTDYDMVPDKSGDTLYALWSHKVEVRFVTVTDSLLESRFYYPGYPFIDGIQDYYDFPECSDNDSATFRGWTSDKEGKHSVNILNTVPDTLLTLYAQWVKKTPSGPDVPPVEPTKIKIYFITDGQYELYEDTVRYYIAGAPFSDTRNLPRNLPPVSNNEDFICWSTTGKIENRVGDDDCAPYRDDTLYAVWSKTVEITFEPSNYGIPPKTYRTGYKFKDVNVNKTGLPTVPSGADGWFTDQTYTKMVSNDDLVPEGLTTLYAKPWSYRYVEFVSNTTDTSFEARTYVLGVPYNSPKNAKPGFPLLTRSHSKDYFLGWYSDAQFKHPVSESDEAVPEITTLYAKWSTNVTVTFYVDGESKDVRTYYAGLPYGDERNEKPGLFNGANKPGEVFLSWVDDFSNSVTDYDTADFSVTKLTARWRQKVEVSFINKGQEDSAKNFYIGLEYGQVPNEGLPKVPDDGDNVFIGWFTKAEGGVQVTDETIVSLEGANKIYLYTRYAKKVPVYFYDFVNKNDTVRYFHSYMYNDYKFAGKLVNPGLPYRPNRTCFDTTDTLCFRGWYHDIKKLSTPLNTAETVKASDIFYAKWGVWVCFNTNGGNYMEDKVYSYDMTYGDLTNGGLPVPVRFGYDFTGWYSDEQLKTLVTDADSVPARAHTLYAAWKKAEAKMVTVSFYTGLSGVDVEPGVYKEFQGYGTPPNPGLPTVEADGYTFDGWYKESDFTTRVDDSTMVLSPDHTLYARWSKLVKISFITNMPDVEQEDIIYRAGLSFYDKGNPGLPQLHRLAYNFIGWYQDKELEQPVDDYTMVTEDMHLLFGKWKEKERVPVTVSFNTWDPDLVLPDSVYYQEFAYLEGPNTGLPAVAREGFVFDGWYADSALSRRVTDTSIVWLPNHTLHAKWISVVKVSFATHTPDTSLRDTVYFENIAYGAPANPGLPVITYRDHIFEGWYKDSLSGRLVTDTSIVRKPDHTLHAKWTTAVTVTFITNLNDVSQADIMYREGLAYGQRPNEGLPVLNRRGFDFEGWFRDSVCTVRVTDTDTVRLPHHTLYAKWTEKTVNVTFVVGQEGVSQPEASVYRAEYAYGEAPNKGLPVLEKDGFAFEGWFKDSLLQERVTDTTVVSLPDHRLFAGWTAVVKVTFVPYMDGITVPDRMYRVGLAYGEAPNEGLPVLTANYYIFEGWYKEYTFTTRVTDSTMVSQPNHRLYAKWTEIPPQEVTVSFETFVENFSIPSKIYVERYGYGEGPNDGLPVLAPEGYVFGGWYKDSAYQIPVTDQTIVTVPDHTLYARWTVTPPKDVKVSFATLVDGIFIEDRIYKEGFAYGEAPNPGLPVLARDGYEFDGWYRWDRGDAYETQVTDQTIVTAPDHNLYAKWTKIPDGPQVGTLSAVRSSVKVYPNPSDGKYTVEVSEATRAFVYNGGAVRVSSYRWDRAGAYEVDLTACPAGIYYLKLNDRTVKLVLR